MSEWYNEEVSLLEYLPACLAENELFAELATAVNYGMKGLKEYTEATIGNCFLLTADLQIIERYERIWNLSADGLTLAARRERIAAKLRERPPINEAMLKSMMSGILGNVVKIIKGHGDYSVILKYCRQSGSENVEFAKNIIRKLIPANLLLEILYAYIEWRNIAVVNWAQLTNYSWKDVMSSETMKADLKI